MKWMDYYEAFGLEVEAIRSGCEPWMMTHDAPVQNGIVLVHGLTDSPYFMRAIGQRFYNWGFNVYIPLLDKHGLKNPEGMKGVKLKRWTDNVAYAITVAKEDSARISIGGLSTGGALSLDEALFRAVQVTGGVFLFSAALGLAGPLGNTFEEALRSLLFPVLSDLQDLTDKPLVSDRADLNPYRYHRMDSDGARELSELIKKLDEWFNDKQSKPLSAPVFAAHSEADTTADIQRIEQLVKHKGSAQSTFFRIGQAFHVPHASVVLEKPVQSANGSFLEPNNPFFSEMMALAHQFCQQHLGAV